MAKKKASVPAASVERKAAQKKVSKGTATKKSPSKQLEVLHSVPLPDYALRAVGRFGPDYYYLMLRCPYEQEILGVLKSRNGNLSKVCALVDLDDVGDVVLTDFLKVFAPQNDSPI
jgi:hypothetical protein